MEPCHPALRARVLGRGYGPIGGTAPSNGPPRHTTRRTAARGKVPTHNTKASSKYTTGATHAP